MAQVAEVSSRPLSFFEDSGSCPPGFQLSPYCSLKTQLKHTSSVMVPWAGVDFSFSPGSLSCSSPWICVSALCSRSVKNIWCLHVRVLECVSVCAHTHAHTHVRGGSCHRVSPMLSLSATSPGMYLAGSNSSMTFRVVNGSLFV